MPEKFPISAESNKKEDAEILAFRELQEKKVKLEELYKKLEENRGNMVDQTYVMERVLEHSIPDGISLFRRFHIPRQLVLGAFEEPSVYNKHSGDITRIVGHIHTRANVLNQEDRMLIRNTDIAIDGVANERIGMGRESFYRKYVEPSKKN